MSDPRTFLDGRVVFHAGDCALLRPHASLASRRALEVGKAAEYLVVADLILAGHRAFLTDQGLPYDVVFDHGGRLFRIQVKASATHRSVPNRPGYANSYMYHIRRAGKGSKRLIGNNEFDILALVAIDIRTIAYIRFDDRVLQTINLRGLGAAKTHGNKSYGNIDEYPISKLIDGISS